MLFELVAGRLVFDGQPITEELDARLVIRVQDHLANLKADVLEDIDDLTQWDCVLCPDETLYALRPDLPKMPLPEGYVKIKVINVEEIVKIIENSTCM